MLLCPRPDYRRVSTLLSEISGNICKIATKIICVQAYCGKHCCFLRELINEIPVFCFFVLCAFHVFCALCLSCTLCFSRTLYNEVCCHIMSRYCTFSDILCFFSIFCAREKSQKTSRICSRGSLLLTLLGSWERKGGFIKQFYLKNSALLSLICYKRSKRLRYMIKKGTTRST